MLTKNFYPAELENALIHKYAASGHMSYVGLLEIINPPKDKEKFIVDFYSVNTGYLFCESPDFDIATKAFRIISSGFYNEIFIEWKEIGIKKMYQSLNNRVLPWFYKTEHNFIFGKENQFTINKNPETLFDGMKRGDEIFTYSENINDFVFENFVGAINQQYLLWNSGRMTKYYFNQYSLENKISSRVICSINDQGWLNNKAIRSWFNFLSGEYEGGEKEIRLKLSSYILELNLSKGLMKRIDLNLVLLADNEIVLSKTYHKPISELPVDLYSLYEDKTLILKIIRFFIS